MALIAPHGADALRPVIVGAARRAELETEAETLPYHHGELGCRGQCSDDGGGILHPPDRLHESG